GGTGPRRRHTRLLRGPRNRCAVASRHRAEQFMATRPVARVGRIRARCRPLASKPMRRFTRGFVGRKERDPRLPPGQYDTGRSWPVLTAEVTPKLDVASWTFRVQGLVEHPQSWTWDEIHALTPDTYAGDIHCVTTWSKLAMTFTGVSVDTLLGLASPL